MPPEWMWAVDHELERWFERLDDERDDRSNSDRRERVPMMDNELARNLRER